MGKRTNKPLPVVVELVELKKSRVFGVTEKKPPEYFELLSERLKKILRRSKGEEKQGVKAEQKEIEKIIRKAEAGVSRTLLKIQDNVVK
jgi:hypothetical protein